MPRHEEPPDNVVQGPWQIQMTDEEQQILTALQEGRTAREIAGELGLSYSTARRKAKTVVDKYFGQYLDWPPSSDPPPIDA
jgi:DNA-binding NarL/FixJ family response regulator